jgi:outer membrane protein OmpA-like peptidoglycan-associated protein
MRSLSRSSRPTFFVLLAVLAGASLAACGGSRPPPADLVKARADLQRAKSSVAMQFAPTDVHEAELALDKAEKANRDTPEEADSADLMVIAQLKAQTAIAVGETLKAQKEKEQATRELVDRLQGLKGDLEKTREQLDRERQETATERSRRIDAEKKLQDARDTLSKIASVKDEDRGMVITLQGEVLFKTNESQLKPAAMVKLDQIAETLRGQERKIQVLGHTDNQGGASAHNQQLSEKRAGAVRDYLVSKGIPADLIRAEGKGPSAPIADNSSVDGRAQNRRVEIVVEPKK